MTTTLEPAPPEAPDREPRTRRLPEVGPAWRAARRRFANEGLSAQVARYVALFVVFTLFIEILFHSVLSVAYLVDGIALGSLYGIVGVALILIYRTNRIINFAAAAVGPVPAIAAVFLRYTRIGIALRASAENADRASLLGIPVQRVQTVAWIMAGALAAMAILVSSPLIGVPQDASLGFKTLLYGLTAAVVARMERIGLALAAGLGIGVIIFGAVAKYGSDDYASALMLLVILVALLVQRGALSRAYDAGTSTWEAVKMFRPIPAELRGQREVIIGRIVLFAASIALVVIVPFVIGKPNIPDLIVLPIFGIVAVSLVILTGWAGQISLGQFGIVAAGALVAGGLAANHNIEFFEAVAIGVAAGVVVSVIIGLPAVRIQGLYLAVTTLAFAYAMVSYVLNTHYPIGRHL